MQGFFVSNFKNAIIPNHKDRHFDDFSFGGFKCFRITIDKFLKDRIVEENDDYLIVTEGIFLNKKELMMSYSNNSFSNTICQMIKKRGKSIFFDDFRGSFSGAVYDNIDGKIINYLAPSTLSLIKDLYNKGTVLEKTQCVTVLCAINRMVD